MSIEQLTAAMAAGDAEAIAAFYRRYFDAMRTMTRRAVPDRHRDEAFQLDVVHDAMLRIVRCVRPMATEAHLLNWTRLVVQSCAIDRLRQEQRRRRRERATARPETAAADDRSEDDGLADDQTAWIVEQIARLEPTLARMFQLRYADGWTLARIAAAFGSTTGRVDGQLRRAVVRLREQAERIFDDRSKRQ